MIVEFSSLRIEKSMRKISIKKRTSSIFGILDNDAKKYGVPKNMVFKLFTKENNVKTIYKDI